MTFKEFLLHRAPTYDAEGDFVRLVLADVNFPADSDWEEMRTYFFHSFGSFYLAEAGEGVWTKYKQSRRAGLRLATSQA